jgi:signal transduction histidine kinase
MVYHDQLVGMLVACYPADREPDATEVTFLGAIADQGAIAVQNARLLQQGSLLAALEERQKLARDLHDSVSQALYGIALGSRTARSRLGETGDRGVTEAVDYVLQLAETGLTETRALIFELIPESLENEGLVVAVKRQAAATQARHQVAVHMDLGEEPELPLKVKEEVYRIAQESLNNIGKHANAQNAYVSLRAEGSIIKLEVRDDGAGFDPNGEFPGHLGLRSMQERARKIGGDYQIRSAAGKGAAITLSIPIATP